MREGEGERRCDTRQSFLPATRRVRTSQRRDVTGRRLQLVRGWVLARLVRVLAAGAAVGDPAFGLLLACN